MSYPYTGWVIHGLTCSAGGAARRVPCILPLGIAYVACSAGGACKNGYHAHGGSGAGVASLEAPPLRGRAAATPQLPSQQLPGSLLYGLCQDLLQHGQGPVLARAVSGKPCCLHSQTLPADHGCLAKNRPAAAHMFRETQSSV